MGQIDLLLFVNVHLALHKCLDLSSKNLDLIRGILTATFEVYRVFFSML